MILTGVPYQHKVSKEIFVPDDITTNGVFIHAFGNGMVRFEVDKAAFLKNFERVHEAPPPKGWDEEL